MGFSQEKAGERGQLLQVPGTQSTEDADLLNFKFIKKNDFPNSKYGRIKVRQAMNLKLGTLQNLDISINTSIQFSATT